ncbi:MAG TPA: hypothetical protein DDX91_04970 [Ruminococcaceae bacterium]|nr:hypothetical protein [Oscillospiraceae bacterium]
MHIAYIISDLVKRGSVNLQQFPKNNYIFLYIFLFLFIDCLFQVLGFQGGIPKTKNKFLSKEYDSLQ